MRRSGAERGQTAVDYVGILVLVVLIALGLLEAGLGTRVAQIVGSAADSIGQQSVPGANGGGLGAGGSGSSGSSPAAGGDASASAGSDWIPCNTRPELPGCALQVAVAPNGFREGVRDRARQRYRTAMRNMRNSGARAGTPEFERLRAEVQNARDDLVRSRAITEHPLLKGLAGARKFFDPRFDDVAPAVGKLRSGLREIPSQSLRSPSSGAAARGANRFLGGLGKFGRGLGAVGVAFGAYTNVRADGVGKGLTKTAAGAVGGWAAATGVGMACAAVGVATAGVGAVACGVGALAASVGAGMVASKAAGWAWDQGSAAVHWGGHQISRGVSAVARTASKPLEAVGKGLSRLGSALRPGFL